LEGFYHFSWNYYLINIRGGARPLFIFHIQLPWINNEVVMTHVISTWCKEYVEIPNQNNYLFRSLFQWVIILKALPLYLPFWNNKYNEDNSLERYDGAVQRFFLFWLISHDRFEDNYWFESSLKFKMEA